MSGRKVVINIDTLVLPPGVPTTRQQIARAVSVAMRRADRRDFQRLERGAARHRENLTIDEATAARGPGESVLRALHQVTGGPQRAR